MSIVHRNCNWCGTTMGIVESEDYHLEGQTKVYCCFFCRQFASRDDVETYKARIVVLAINPMYSWLLKYPWV